MSKAMSSRKKSMFGKWRKAKEPSFLDRAAQLQVKFEIHDEMLLKLLDMVSFSAEEVRLARAIQPIITEHASEIVDTFYNTITSVEHLKDIIITHSSVDRLRKTLEIHLINMFSGNLDDAYLEKVNRIANVHYNIGLEPRWYMAAFQNLQATLIQIVNSHIDDRAQFTRISEVVMKLLNFEQQLVLEAYEKKSRENFQQHEDNIKQELKAKIIAVTEDMANITERTNASV